MLRDNKVSVEEITLSPCCPVTLSLFGDDILDTLCVMTRLPSLA